MKAMVTCLLTAIAVLCFHLAPAQINPKKILQKKANEVINKKADQVLDSTSQNKNGDQNKNGEKPKETNQSPANKDANAGNKQDNPAGSEKQALQTYSKFDFIPGEKVIFFDDFTQDNTGDFPALWNTNGSGEVVTTNLYPGRWLQFSSRNSIWTDALLNLPDNYTIEFDVVPIKSEEGRMSGYSFRLIQSINARAFDHGSVPGKAGFSFFIEYFGRPGYRSYINGNEGSGLGLNGFKEGEEYKQKLEQKYHISLWVQKARVRVYQDEVKLFDLPKAFPLSSVKMDRIRFEDGAAMISNVRIAVGAPDLRNKLLTEGKIISYGIYFDVNRDVVKPESYGSLKEIATTLSENPGVKIRIVGHTDADGANDANLDLSRRRAASVKNELVKTFGIDAARMETDGMGESKPVAPNDTPSNKALNRRVEFIKL